MFVIFQLYMYIPADTDKDGPYITIPVTKSCVKIKSDLLDYG